MKRIFVFLITIAVLLSLVTAVSAEETMTADSIVQETESTTEETAAQTTETSLPEETDGGTQENETEIDFEAYAEQFVGYIFSGAERSDELMDKIIAMGEQYQLSKEQGYTLEERINQLLTPENIMTTIAAAFLLICGIAFFIFRRRQKLDTAKISVELKDWKKKYEAEAETNKKLRSDIEKQTKEIGEMKELLISLTERSDLSKKDMSHIEHTAVAVAKMVKDVFLNSKTIDASGKALLVHNYVEALGEADEPAKECANE